jgi:hypothetical protein
MSRKTCQRGRHPVAGKLRETGFQVSGLQAQMTVAKATNLRPRQQLR